MLWNQYNRAVSKPCGRYLPRLRVLSDWILCGAKRFTPDSAESLRIAEGRNPTFWFGRAADDPCEKQPAAWWLVRMSLERSLIMRKPGNEMGSL